MSVRKSSFESQRLSAPDFVVLRITFDHMLAQLEKCHPGDDSHGRYLMAEYLSDALLHYMFNDCPERTNERTNNVKTNSSDKKAEKPETSQPSRTSPRLAKAKESSVAASSLIIPVRTTRRSRICQAATDDTVVHDLLVPPDEDLTNNVSIVRSALGKRKRGICEETGCHRSVVKGNHLSSNHGGASKKRCSIPECTNLVRQGGVCSTHGATRPKCRYPECTNLAAKGGVCIRHGATRPKCSQPGCLNQSTQGGLCCRHGAKMPICKHPGCNHLARQGGVCTTHGAKRPK